MFKHDLLYDTPSYLIVLVLAALMMTAIVGGRKFARKRKSPDQTGSDNSGPILGALFGLLGFMLAFTYNMSDGRYAKRRQNIVEESNYIGTALLRCDLYPDSVRNLLRADFYHYIQARIDYFDSKRDNEKAQQASDLGNHYSHQVWNQVITYSKAHPGEVVVSNQMIPAVNAMIDIVITRQAGNLATVPWLIIAMLFVLCTSTSFFSGYTIGHKKIDWVVVTGFIITISMVTYITLDLDRPRRGIITLEPVAQHIVNLQQEFTDEEIKLYRGGK